MLKSIYSNFVGNQSTALTDEPTGAIAQRNLQHFDHPFKADLHTASGIQFEDVFGECKFAKRPVTLVCKANAFEVVEELGITTKHQVDVSYGQITGLAWDHANSEVKITTQSDQFIILILANSIEFESEMKLRLSAAASMGKLQKVPSPMYVGMFAGATKPKPFQRKRPNLSNLPSGKLPTLHDMRASALDLHRGSYRPCPQGESRRMEIALQHIYEGFNTFPLLNVRGASSVANQYRSDSLLLVTDEALVFKPRGLGSDIRVEFPYDDIETWNAIDNDKFRMNDSGIEIVVSSSGETIFFGVQFVRDVKHTVEYFWNTFKTSQGQLDQIKLGSTHGRPIVNVHTLSGEMPPPESPVGQVDVVDQDGIVVRAGGKMAPRRGSIASGITGNAKEPKVVPTENKAVKKHWHKVVMHQGWMLKQGGVGVGTNKSWIKRYFVLYKTSQGHFLVYYSDFTECPMFTPEKHHRNIVDLAKATFIRPGSNKADNPDTPAYCFDIVTTEREWTLCAESQENVQRWLKLLTRAVDEDVAILPDEELIFKVKPKLDPLQALPSADYSTTLKVSANGISVCIPDKSAKDSNNERELYFWVYTDFYKWSLMCPDGKFALLLNVFADSSFSRRYEYIFRTKEAHRLATAIEYFIEKFMSVMHIRLETTEGAFNDVEVRTVDDSPHQPSKGGMHEISVEEQQAQELDLLGLEITDSPYHQTPNHSPKAGASSSANKSSVADPFGSNPFGEDEPATTQQMKSSGGLLDDDDLLLGPSIPPPSVPQSSAPSSAPTSFGDDLFGSDPFGTDPFTAAPAKLAAAVKVAPPITPQQEQQHRSWFLAALSSSGGPIYDDGTLQIAAKIEVRGSQARLTFFLVNQSPGSLSDFKFEIHDSTQFLRHEVQGDKLISIGGLGRATHVIMAECMKPAGPGAKIGISYNDTLKGIRNIEIDLPILLASFNEPINGLTAEDFSKRWQQLNAAGQEVQEVLKPSFAIVPNHIKAAMTSALKFGQVSGLPDSSEYVLYGASSLRTGAKGANGEKISVGSLIKIEMNVQANAIRVTLRTLHPAASTSILQSTKAIFV